MIIAGIDPGRTGAIAWLSAGVLTTVRDLPMDEVKIGKSLRKRLNPAVLADWVDELRPDKVYLEEVGVMPKEGAVGAFSFGRGFGQIEGVLAALQIPYVLVKPAKWKLAMGVPADKGSAVARALREFPASKEHFIPKRLVVTKEGTIGRAEAALIALYGSRQP